MANVAYYYITLTTSTNIATNTMKGMGTMEPTFTINVTFSSDRVIDDHPEWYDEDNDEYTGPEPPAEIYENGISLMAVANILGGISKQDQEFIDYVNLEIY